MNSRPPSSRSAFLIEGAVTGALAGAIEARCALPPVHPPVLSIGEWWMSWAASVAMGLAWGLLVGSFVALAARGSRPRVHGLTVGLTLFVWILPRVFLSLRPHLGPDGRLPTLAVASGVALLSLAVPIFAWGHLPRKIFLAVGGTLAAAATISGAVLAPVASPSTADENRPPSLLLITLDTMRADHLPPAERYLPPDGFLRRLQREGIAWTQLTAPIPLTGPSHSSLLTALVPERHGAQDNGWPIAPGVETLAEGLKARGYVTGAVLSAAVLHRELCGLQRGFDEYDDSFRAAEPLRRLVPVTALQRGLGYLRGRSGGLSHRRRAHEVVDIGLRFLRRHPHEPFFLWLHFYDAHGPYQPRSAPVPVGELVAVPGEPPLHGDRDYWRKRARYAAEIVDVDRELSRFATAFAHDERSTGTVVVAVTDHGESFGTHGHGYRFDHGAYLYDDELQLTAWWRECDQETAAAQATDRPFTMSELTRRAHRPAGMEVLGRCLRERFQLPAIDEPMNRDSGYSLSHSMVPADTLWFCLRRPTRKLIVGRAPSGELVYEAFDLAHDAAERHDLLGDHRAPHEQTTLRLGSASRSAWVEDERILLDWAEHIHTGLQGPHPELSDAARARLRSLGYVR